MKTRPILFSAPMVRAILDGRKTQTRRIVKPQPTCAHVTYEGLTVHCFNERGKHLTEECFHNWTHKAAGDQLWVKETFLNNALEGYDPVYFYRADDDVKPADRKWKPSIFMPRSASRITLEIESVRVQRLRDISAKDAIAEGIYPKHIAANWGGLKDPIATYQELWESINGPGSWTSNPWVWVLTFRRIKP